MIDLINPEFSDTRHEGSTMGELYFIMENNPKPLSERVMKGIIRLLVSKINQLSEISNQQQEEIVKLKQKVK